MNTIDLNVIDRLYHSINFPREILGKYESSVIQGFKNEMDWTKLSDTEKLNFREQEIDYAKVHFKNITPEIVFSYEENVIELGREIINFLEATTNLFEKVDELAYKNKELLTLFRLRNLLFCELYAINKHRKLKFGGHVLLEEIVEIVFDELKTSEFYEYHKLETIRNKYKLVLDIYERKPYNEMT
jgi:hypothetical protein